MAKVTKNTLEPNVERWDDPGDYPNNVASGPLPSYDYLAGIEGEVQVELTDEEVADYNDCPEDFIDNLDIDRPAGILSVEWTHELKGNVLVLEVKECEPDPDYDPTPDPPDDDDERWERRHRDD